MCVAKASVNYNCTPLLCHYNATLLCKSVEKATVFRKEAMSTNTIQQKNKATDKDLVIMVTSLKWGLQQKQKQKQKITHLMSAALDE